MRSLRNDGGQGFRLQSAQVHNLRGVLNIDTHNLASRVQINHDPSCISRESALGREFKSM